MPQSPRKHEPRGAIARQKRATQSAYDRDRGNSAQRGYGHAWRKARLAFLREHPLCAQCRKAGRVTAATCVDHIVPHRGDERLFWDAAGNWQALCAPCHNAKTAKGL